MDQRNNESDPVQFIHKLTIINIIYIYVYIYIYYTQVAEIDDLRDQLGKKNAKIKKYKAQIEQLQLSINIYANDRNERKPINIKQIHNIEEIKLNEDNINNINKYNDELWELKKKKVRELDVAKHVVTDFKYGVISALNSIKDEVIKKDIKLRSLHSRLNSSYQEKTKLQKDRDRVIKQKEQEIKSLRSKNNEIKSEVARVKQSVGKIERDAALAKDQIAKKVEKLENDKKALQQKLERQVFV